MVEFKCLGHDSRHVCRRCVGSTVGGFFNLCFLISDIIKIKGGASL